MYLAYVDESGDDGRPPKGSRSYALGCVMVDGAEWAAAFDQMIEFRRFVKQRYRIPVRAELKANYLLRNGGPLRARPLSEAARFSLYRGFMRLPAKVGVTAFAVVIDKPRAAQAGTARRVASDIAWEYLLQRLERRSHYERTEIVLVHDEGDTQAVRRHARKTRRAGTAGSAFGTGTLKVPFLRLIDDPIPRQSHQSYFLQLADMAAYAAFRRMYPPRPHPRGNVVPERMWHELGSALFAPVRTATYGDPPGIVPRP